MENFKLQTFGEHIVNESKATGTMPKNVNKNKMKKLEASIMADKKYMKHHKGDAQLFLLENPYMEFEAVGTANNGGYDSVVYGCYFSPVKKVWKKLVVRFPKKTPTVYVPKCNMSTVKKIKGLASITPENLKAASYKIVAKKVINLINTASQTAEATAKVKKKATQTEMPEVTDTKAVAKWLATYFEKTKGVTIQASNGEKDTIIFFWSFSFKPTIAKFKQEEWHDMFINLDTKEIGAWDRSGSYPQRGVSYGTMQTLKKLPKDMREIMKWEKEKVINKFNNSSANTWHY